MSLILSYTDLYQTYKLLKYTDHICIFFIPWKTAGAEWMREQTNWVEFLLSSSPWQSVTNTLTPPRPPSGTLSPCPVPWTHCWNLCSCFAAFQLLPLMMSSRLLRHSTIVKAMNKQMVGLIYWYMGDVCTGSQNISKGSLTHCLLSQLWREGFTFHGIKQHPSKIRRRLSFDWLSNRLCRGSKRWGKVSNTLEFNLYILSQRNSVTTGN